MNLKLLKRAAVFAAVIVSGGAHAAQWVGHGRVGVAHTGGFHPAHMGAYHPMHIGGVHPMTPHLARNFAAPAFTASRPAMNLAPRPAGGARSLNDPPAMATRPSTAVPDIAVGGGGGFAPTVPVTVPNVNTCPGFLAPNCNPMQCVCSIAGP